MDNPINAIVKIVIGKRDEGSESVKEVLNSMNKEELKELASFCKLVSQAADSEVRNRVAYTDLVMELESNGV